MPGVPASLPPLGVTDRRATRLDLARWLVTRDNPLVARVMVNRLWKLAFGQGLVTTADDFGSQGTWPTHPELLDWLACRVRRQRLGRQGDAQADRDVGRPTASRPAASESTVSATPPTAGSPARTASGSTPSWSATTPWPSAGCSPSEIGGPSVKPYQPAGYWVFLNFPTREYHADHGDNQYRRGLYTYWQRTFLHPSLLAFDASTREECVVQRPRSNTPLQALVLLERPDLRRGGAGPGRPADPRGGHGPAARLDRAFRLALARPPRPAEVAVLIGAPGQASASSISADPAAARAAAGHRRCPGTRRTSTRPSWRPGPPWPACS